MFSPNEYCDDKRNVRRYIFDFRDLNIKTRFYFIVVNPHLCDSGGCTHFISISSATVITEEKQKWGF